MHASVRARVSAWAWKRRGASEKSEWMREKSLREKWTRTERRGRLGTLDIPDRPPWPTCRKCCMQEVIPLLVSRNARRTPYLTNSSRSLAIVLLRQGRTSARPLRGQTSSYCVALPWRSSPTNSQNASLISVEARLEDRKTGACEIESFSPWKDAHVFAMDEAGDERSACNSNPILLGVDSIAQCTSAPCRALSWRETLFIRARVFPCRPEPGSACEMKYFSITSHRKPKM